MAMTPEQFQQVYPVLSVWIRDLLELFRERAHPVASVRFGKLSHYYSADFLERAKFVVVPRIPIPPLSRMGISQFGALETADFGGAAYLDTFFVKQGQETEPLFFHELVHVVQWAELGPERFLSAYADGLEKYGYAESPLEVMAYKAQWRFEADDEYFDVVKFVKGEIANLTM